MARLSEAVTRLDEELFVGRQRELTAFRHWVDEDSRLPALLNVCGRGGVGKTTLLHAFRRSALALGKTVLLVDGRDFPATPQGFLAALTDSADTDPDAVAGSLNRARPLILFDTFEHLGDLTKFILEEFLVRLDTSVKVVIAGRHPLTRSWDPGDRWYRFVRRLPVSGFSIAESREYLARRGVHQSELARRVMCAAGGNPLALSLAADMVIQFDARDFSAAPEWHLAVRWLAERLLHDINDPGLREVLEACSVVRQFDESTLAAITDHEDVSASFNSLCRLSVVTPSEHGLQLHEDVRRHVAADLRWRQPRRYSLLRARAFAHYRERLRSAPLRDREWLVVECFFLWGNSLIQEIFFDPCEPGRIRVEPPQPSDVEEIEQLLATRMAPVCTTDLGDEALFPPNSDRVFLDALLCYPSSRIRVAREESGRLLGFSTVLPICQDSIRLLELNSAISHLLHAYLCPEDLKRLPSAPDEATSFCLCHLIHAEDMPGPVRAALLRDFTGLLGVGGTYLCSTLSPSYKTLLEACGFTRIGAAQYRAGGTIDPFDGYVLDLSRIGFERWIEAMVGGLPLPHASDPGAIEKALREVLVHWDDDEWLAQSSLTHKLGSRLTPDLEKPRQLREIVLSTLTEMQAVSSTTKRPAYEALALAYLVDGSTRKKAARQLGASRAKFYRLVHRGVHDLAQRLTQSL